MKTHRSLSPAVLILALIFGLGLGIEVANAQGLKRSSQSGPSLAGKRAEPLTATAPALSPSVPKGVQQADYIVALVNSEPITNYEVSQRLSAAVQQLNQQGVELPPRNVLVRQVLERIVNDRAQVQLARETGIKVDEVAVDQAEQNMARQNQMEVAQLRRRLAEEGISSNRFRDDLRQQLILQRLREREVEGRVRVTDQDVEQFLIDQRNTVDSRLELNLAHIMVAVPEGATPVQVAALEKRAQRALDRARAGDDYAALVSEYSDGPERVVGGQIGLRTVDRLPTLFVEATKSLESGGLSGVLRSPAGFHVLKVIERQYGDLPGMKVTQSRVRHILLRPTPQLDEAAARDRLFDFRQRIQAGKADFADLAKQFSQDGSAKQGGDLGWASPGMFVPEFEDVMNSLAPGEIAPPLVSRFGVHLIQLMERREASLTPAEQRQVARNLVREKKLDEAYVNWAQEVRGRAFVELRDPPE